ncbi:MAG: type II toxin-antitoxin system RelE/ParE family toxin [Chloroflexota bacterium]|nr:type II toxin-antitoxin system RelE/ParE family toxin [Chloroflexota bacterium]
MYDVRLENTAQREFRKLPADQRTRVQQALIGLESNPRPPGCKKVRGTDSAYRIRVGSLRILYTVDRDLVVVFRISPRSRAYR